MGRARKPATGVCIRVGCGQPKVVASYCEEHRSADRARLRQRYRDLRVVGFCTDYSCKQPAVPGKSYCQRHLDYRACQRRKEVAKKRLTDATWVVRQLAKKRNYRKSRIQDLKREVAKGYGGHCKCCGEDQIEFLTIDHIDRTSRHKDRKMNRRDFLASIIKKGFPKSFQVLCFNCNCAKQDKGFCPHELHFRLIIGGRS